MKTKLIISTLFISALTPTLTHAFGNSHTWMSNKTQGVTEFVILGQGQSQLYLSCDDEGHQPATIIFTDINGRQARMDADQSLEMKFAGEEAANVSESESHIGAQFVQWAWNMLRSEEQVTVFGEGVASSTFTLNGAATVIPYFGENGCVPKFVF
ncbi:MULTISPECIES: hypothetical protein [Providencia]|uniref:hypothetical protein n=1 Tax=Providencia TaxID=586 RepID=UPI00065E6D44|nr:hypothetical protein [Providencia rettgeri]UEK59209.1 hypothetical protein LL668_18275 [Providencia rettgeri]